LAAEADARARIAEANRDTVISNNVRTVSAALGEHVAELRDNLLPRVLTPPARGQKPHVAVDNDKPGGDAA
jgi:hypothetical protein